MIINKLQTTLAFILLAGFALSQGTVDRDKFCSHDQDLYDRYQTDANFAREVDSVEQVQNAHLASYKESSNRAGTIYYIPVVYHVLHEGGAENISDAQIKSDLKDLNDTYRKRNANVGAVNPAFSGISADVEIEFRLAQKKNDGSCFSGITRTYSATTNTGGNGAADAVKLEHGDFPGNKYMNIYVAKNIGGAAGYTYRPGPPFYADMRNGIHVLHTYVGTIGTSTQTGYNTTISHEAGHWLNLAHLWGNSNNPGLSSNCSGDDGVSDTPNSIGWTSCNTSGVSCGTLDNVENVMEYSYCSKMFTNGQKTRMRAAVTSSTGGRNNLITASNHTSTGIFDDILCRADFEAEGESVCENKPIQFYDNSYHNATSWNWSFPGGTPSTSNQQNPIVTYNNPGRHNVSLTVTNASGTISLTKTQYMRVLPDWGLAMPFTEGFEITESQFEDSWETIADDTNSWSLNSANFSGSNSAMLRNYTISDGQESEIVSPSLNLTGNTAVNISFKYAYARKTTSTGESVQFLISNNCGESWVIARGLNPTTAATNSEFFPTSNQWGAQNITINNSFYSSNFRFKIKVTNGNGNNFFIDDININTTVGIEEVEGLTDLNLYPNPMNNNATVSLNLSKESEVSVSLLNTLGQTVRTISSEVNLNQGEHNMNIEKGNLVPGIYFLSVNLNGNKKIEKLIIQ
ncbi:MAG: M43 family zinc metalloprotease [Flavobacteriales bacterium]